MGPRAILEVRWGPLAGTRAVLRPGDTLRVGRTDGADLVVAHDALMSGVHFELSWDGARCLARDLGSATGTLLRGAPVTEAEVPHGGWLRAGTTDLCLYIEAHTPPPEPDEDAPAETLAAARWKERTLALLHDVAEQRPLFALLDAARDDRILVLLRESVEIYRSLYDGVQGAALEEVAPYLVQLPRGSDLLTRLLVEGWCRRWGIYISAPLPLRDLRRHLRRFLKVEDEAGEPLYFRFYDPAVLRAFVPTCAPRQRDDFFGDIEELFAEGRDGELLRFARAAGRQASARGAER